MNWILGLVALAFLLYVLFNYKECTYHVGGLSTTDKHQYHILRSRYPNKSHGCGGPGMCNCD